MINPYLQYMYSYPHKTAYRTLTDVSLTDYADRLSGSGHGLYLHIPFCEAKCGYCNLFSVTGQREQEIDAYLDAVKRQIHQYREVLYPYQSRFSEITIGGGTPLLLSKGQLEQIFLMVNQSFSFSGQLNKREIIIETAPNQTTREKLQILKQAEVSRVSMGIQSFSDKELITINRRHRAETARKALNLLMSFEFPCVNLDFIYGIPGQTAASFLQSLKEAIRFAPDELFLYPLYLKHGAGLQKTFSREKSINPQEAYQQYQEAADFLQAEGFRQDSMRRFVRIKQKHPLPDQNTQEREFSSCGSGTSLALGCGGRSYLGNLHFCTPYAITQKECLAQIKQFEETRDFMKITHGIFLSEEELKRRYVIRHLLIYPGLNSEDYQNQFQALADEDFPVLKEWIEKGYVCRKKNGRFFSLTRLGLGLSDFLGPQLISPDIRAKMEEWDNDHEQGNA